MAGLEHGWIVVPRAMLGDGAAAPAVIDIVLLHPARGVALLEAPPHWTPGAPVRLRRRLDQARFAAIFPGHLPVVHLALLPGALGILPQALAAAFAAEPALSLPGGDAWMQAVQRALRSEPEASPPARPARRRGGRATGIAGLVLGCGIAGTVLLLHPVGRLADPVRSAQAVQPVMSLVEAGAVKLPAPPVPGPANLQGPQGGAKDPPPEDASPAETEDSLAPPTAPPPPAGPLDALLPIAAPATLPLPMAPPDPPAPPPPDATDTAAPAAQAPVDPALVAALLRRGDGLLALGDVSAARLFYARAAAAGSAAGALAAARTYDSDVLGALGVRGIRPDPEAAARWQRRAHALAAQETRP